MRRIGARLARGQRLGGGRPGRRDGAGQAEREADREENGAQAGDTVVIGRGDKAVIFDFEPTIRAGAELMMGRRGTDLRFEPGARTRKGKGAVDDELAAIIESESLWSDVENLDAAREAEQTDD